MVGFFRRRYIHETYSICHHRLRLGLVAHAALAGGQQSTTEPSAAQVRQKALQDGPSTMQMEYLTHKQPVAPHRDAAPTDPRLLRPLTKREIGMLYNACIAYAECASSYSRAYAHNQALLKAHKDAGDSGQ